jgi:hypothetical protein
MCQAGRQFATFWIALVQGWAHNIWIRESKSAVIPHPALVASQPSLRSTRLFVNLDLLFVVIRMGLDLEPRVFEDKCDRHK